MTRDCCQGRIRLRWSLVRFSNTDSKRGHHARDSAEPVQLPGLRIHAKGPGKARTEKSLFQENGAQSPVIAKGPWRIDEAWLYLDVAIAGEATVWRVSHETAGLTELRSWIAAGATGHAVKVPNPRQMRALARAPCPLAKTGALGAQVLACFAAVILTPARPSPDPETRELRDMVAIRCHLVTTSPATHLLASTGGNTGPEQSPVPSPVHRRQIAALGGVALLNRVSDQLRGKSTVDPRSGWGKPDTGAHSLIHSHLDRRQALPCNPQVLQAPGTWAHLR